MDRRTDGQKSDSILLCIICCRALKKYAHKSSLSKVVLPALDGIAASQVRYWSSCRDITLLVHTSLGKILSDWKDEILVTLYKRKEGSQMQSYRQQTSYRVVKRPSIWQAELTFIHYCYYH